MAVDSSTPYRVRLEQIFPPSIELSRPLTARASLRPRVRPAAARRRGATPQRRPRRRRRSSSATFEGVARDLRESPFPLALDLAAVPDGSYTPCGGSPRSGSLARDGDIGRCRVEGTRRAPARAREPRRQRRRSTCRPTCAIRPTTSARSTTVSSPSASSTSATSSTAADAIAAGAKTGKSPFGGAHRRLRAPLPAAGSGRDHAVPRLRADDLHRRRSRRRSSSRCTASAAAKTRCSTSTRAPSRRSPKNTASSSPPLWATAPTASTGPAIVAGVRSGGTTTIRSQRAGRDGSRPRMREQYKVDDSRIYLMGHSMGAIGTWALGAKYPDLWAALGPVSGTGSPATVAKMRHIPWFVVHGDADPTVQRERLAQHGGGDEEAGRRGGLRRSAGRQPHQHRGTEFPGDVRVLRTHRKTVTTSQQ